MEPIHQENIFQLISEIREFVKREDALVSRTMADLEKEKRSLQKQHETERAGIQNRHKNIKTTVLTRLDQIYKETCSIRDRIIEQKNRTSVSNKLLSFAKAKKEPEPQQAETTYFELRSVEDCALALGKIRSDFTAINSSHFSGGTVLERGLYTLLNTGDSGNSAKLDALHSTINSFLMKMEREKETIINNSLQGYGNNFEAQSEEFRQRSERERAELQRKHTEKRKELAAQIYLDLNRTLPDETVEQLYKTIKYYYSHIGRVNLSGNIGMGILNMAFLDYEVMDSIRSNAIRSVFQKKCEKILIDGSLWLPVSMPASEGPAWLIEGDNTNPTAVQSFTHSVMLGMLSAVPVGHLTYSIADPEKRGNSIAPYFEIKKMLPELFGDKICCSKEEIAAKISKLNTYIENTVQNKLGSRYHTIYEYAKDNSGYTAQTELLILYDFPKGFDEHTLGELLNIVRNGSRCGIYTVIAYQRTSGETYSAEYQQSIREIWKHSLVIKQYGEEFSLRDIPLIAYETQEEKISRMFHKYILFYEAKKTDSIVIPPLVHKLAVEEDASQADIQAAQLCQMKEYYQKKYAEVPETENHFPEKVTLGNICYPADVFSGSVGYHQIIDLFGCGDFKKPGGGSIELPLTFDVSRGFHLYLDCPEKNSKEILAFTHHMIWSFLSFMPVSKVDACVFDGEQRGNSIIPFLDFRKRCPDVFGDKIYTSQEAMYERLKKIDNKIDEFIQDKLGNKYRNFLEYNQNTPNRSEAATLLLIYDFPSGMDRRNLELLNSILRNGGKCGVYVIICHNPEVPFSRYESMDSYLEDMKRYCTRMEYRNGEYRILPYNLQVKIPEMPSGAELDEFIKEYTRRLDKLKRQGISFEDILPDELFASKSAKILSIPVGVGDRDSIIKMTLGEGSSHHGLIAGATGSGKSTLLHTIIMSSMLHYSPDELQLYLMDFKSGTEFKVYESVSLPHIRLLALDAMQEFGESILENLVREMEQRAEAFKEEAGGVTAIKDYIKATGKAMPRILVIMDEFQILFNDTTNRRVAEHCAELAKRIVTEGRAFGIHLLMATQSIRGISNLSLLSGIMEQMLIRVGLKCGEADARYLFSEANCAKAQTMMKGPLGTAVMNLDYTEKPNVGFRVAYCEDAVQQHYLKLISERYAEYPCRLQVFEGKRTELLLDYFRSAGLGRTEELPVRIHMGVPIKVAPPFEIHMDKKRKHNLLICGSDERMAGMVADNYMISALLNQNAYVYCMDGDFLVDDDSEREFYEALSECTGRFRLAEDRGDMIRMIDDVYEQYQNRKKKNSRDAVFVVIKNLQFLDIVGMMLKGERVERKDYLEEEPVFAQPVSSDPASAFDFLNNLGQENIGDDMTVGQKLLKLIEIGSAYGIHFVISSLEYQTVKETMYSYGENTIEKFPERIIFSLSEGDAERLLEGVSVSGLKDNTVYFTDSIREKLRIKPYVSPAVSELKEFFE